MADRYPAPVTCATKFCISCPLSHIKRRLRCGNCTKLVFVDNEIAHDQRVDPAIGKGIQCIFWGIYYRLASDIERSVEQYRITGSVPETSDQLVI